MRPPFLLLRDGSCLHGSDPFMEKTSDTLIGVATYNEIDNLPDLVAEIFRHAPDVDLLMVDDNSPDGTGRCCEQLAVADRRMHCVHRPSKMGLGTATLAIVRHALDRDYKYLVNMDADLSHHPRYLPQLRERMDPPGQGPFDVVIGSRYVPGGAIRGWPLHRRWMSRALNAYVRWRLGLRVRDGSGSFRCYRVSKLRELELSSFRSSGYSVYEEILWRLEQCGARFDEIPIVFADRQHGRTKLNVREAWRALRVIHQLAESGSG